MPLTNNYRRNSNAFFVYFFNYFFLNIFYSIFISNYAFLKIVFMGIFYLNGN